MSEFTGKQLKEARVKKGLSQDEAANLMNVAKRAISEMEAGKRSISADELAQFSRIYNVDVRELLFVEFTEAGDEQSPVLESLQNKYRSSHEPLHAA